MNIFKGNLLQTVLIAFFGLLVIYIKQAEADSGFVSLPLKGFADSAYTLCNRSGEFGLSKSVAPTINSDNDCAVITPNLITSQMNAPIEGFNMVGMLVRDIPMPKPYAGADDVVGTLTDTVWRNRDKNECIYGTHLLMKSAPLANGQSWEVNDIARGGFAGRPVEVAYFYKPHSQDEGGNTEVVFRVGRTFTSVRHAKGDLALPGKRDAPATNKAVTMLQAAEVSENWVDFTTDLNTNDPDGSSRAVSSMLYIKTTCNADQPVELENAIRFRTTSQNGQHPLEVSVPGLVPAGAKVDVY